MSDGPTNRLVWERIRAADDKGPETWSGQLGAKQGVFLVQGPTRYNRQWRIFGALRWKDAETRDVGTFDEAKDVAEQLLMEWVSAYGLRFP